MEPFVLSAQLQVESPTSASISKLRENLKRQLKNLNIAVNLKVGSTQKLSDLNYKIEKVTKSVEKLNSGAIITGNNLRDMGGALGNIRTTLSTISPALSGFNKKVVDVGQATRKAAKETVNFSEQAGLAARRFIAFSLPTAAIFGFTRALQAGVKGIFEFEKEMIKIAQATDRPLTTLNELSKQITEVSTKFGASSSEITTAAKVLSQAGFTAKEVAQSLKVLALTDLSPSFDNMADTTEGLISVFQQFENDASKLEGIFGSINAVSARYAVESKDLVSAIQKTGGAFKVAGGNINELLGLFTSVRQTTRESADTIAVAFRTIFTRLQRPETIEFLRQFNIELTEMGKFVGPVEALKRISVAFSKLQSGDLRRAAIAEEIGGLRQISKTIPLIEQVGLAQEAINVAIKGTTSLTEDATIGLTGFLRQLSQIKEEFLATFREIGQSKTFQKITDAIIFTANSLNVLLRVLKDTIPILALAGSLKLVRGLDPRGFISKFTHRDSPTTAIPFAGGGPVPGPRVNKDIIPSLLMPGEFVLNKQTVDKIGMANLTRINNSSGPPRHSGGMYSFGPVDDLKPLVDTIAAQLGLNIKGVSTGLRSGGSKLLGSMVVSTQDIKGIDIGDLAKKATGGEINAAVGRVPGGLDSGSLGFLTALVTQIKQFGKAIESGVVKPIEEAQKPMEKIAAIETKRAVIDAQRAKALDAEIFDAPGTHEIKGGISAKIFASRKDNTAKQIIQAKAEVDKVAIIQEFQKAAQSKADTQAVATASKPPINPFNILNPNFDPTLRQPTTPPSPFNVYGLAANQYTTTRSSRFQTVNLDDILGPPPQQGGGMILGSLVRATERNQTAERQRLAQIRASDPYASYGLLGPSVSGPQSTSVVNREFFVPNYGRNTSGYGLRQPSGPITHADLTQITLPVSRARAKEEEILRILAQGGAPTAVDRSPRIPLSGPLNILNPNFVPKQRASIGARFANSLGRFAIAGGSGLVSAGRSLRSGARAVGGFVQSDLPTFVSAGRSIRGFFGRGPVPPGGGPPNIPPPVGGFQDYMYPPPGGPPNGPPPNRPPNGSRFGRIGGAVRSLIPSASTVVAIGAGVAGDALSRRGLEKESKVTSALGGALSGVGSGALTGGLLTGGNPIGAVVGGIAGGVIGLVSSLNSFDDAIANKRLSEGLDNLTESARQFDKVIAGGGSLQDINNAASKTRANFGVLIAQEQDTGKRLERRKELREFDAKQLSVILQKNNTGSLSQRLGPQGLAILQSNFGTKIDESNIARLTASMLGVSEASLTAQDNVNKYVNTLRVQASILDLVTSKFSDLNDKLSNVGAQNQFIAGLGEGIGGFQQGDRSLKLGSSLFDENADTFLNSLGGGTEGIRRSVKSAKDTNDLFRSLKASFAGGEFEKLVASGNADQALQDLVGRSTKNPEVAKAVKDAIAAKGGGLVAEGKDPTEVLDEIFSSSGITLSTDKLNEAIEQQAKALDAHANVMQGLAEFNKKILSQQQSVNSTRQSADITIAELRANRTGESLSGLLGRSGTNTFLANQGLLGGGANPLATGQSAIARIQALSAFTAGGGGTTASGISHIIGEQSGIANLVESLRNLTDPANLAADAIRELSEVEEERAARIGLLTNFLGSDRKGKRDFLRTAQNASAFATGGAAFFDTLSSKRQQELIQFISSNGDLSIGGRKLGAIANAELPNTAGGRQLAALGFGVGGLDQRRGDLENEIVKANETAVAAQQQLLEILKVQGALMTDTTKTFEAATIGFSDSVNRFAGAVDRMPATVELTTGPIRVDLGGAGALAGVTNAIQAAVLAEVGNRLKAVVPELSTKVDRAFPA